MKEAVLRVRRTVLGYEHRASRYPVLWLVLGSVLGLLGAACSNAGSGGTDAGVGKGGQETGGSAADTSPLGECPTTLPGPKLVRVPAPDATAYCIDSTEVTGAQYAEFLAAGPDPTANSQGVTCSGNTTLTNGISLPADMSAVGYVDWCDSAAYCHWAGKRLCGKIGGGSGTLASINDATQSEWYNACSAGGTRVYPYGDTKDPEACAGDDIADPRSEGGYPGIFCMIAGLTEWTDECEPVAANPPYVACARRGGVRAVGSPCSQDTDPDAGPTWQLAQSNRNDNLAQIGFRCCYGPGDASS